MKKNVFKIVKIISIWLMLVGVSLAKDHTVTILFTHDLHDHFTPETTLVEGEVVEQGGYAEIKTLMDNIRREEEHVLTVDAGDFSMGTVYQTIYSTEAPGIRLMGMMGYDVVTLGNHEFDFRSEGLEQMLKAATESGDVLPQIVASNLTDIPEGLNEAMTSYGVKDYTIVERGGLRIGVFGLMGEEADSNAPMSGVTFSHYIEEAKRVVGELEKEEVDLIVALSHSGTKEDKKKSEDEILAKEVPGIDVIISGHSHTLLEEAIVVGDTIIVSGGEYGEQLGQLKISQDTEGQWGIDSYELVPVQGSVPNEEINLKIAEFGKKVESNYLKKFGYESGEVVGKSPYHFEEARSLSKGHKELRLANLITDSYIYGVKQAEGEAYRPIDVAIVPNGVIRGSFIEGDITVEEAFKVSSLGIGKDNISGYPLVSAYLTGEELKTIAEVDASIRPLMDVAQLYTSGMHYTFNPNRFLFNKVTDAYLVGDAGERIEIEDDKLYRIVAGLYSAQMLSIVGEQSFGMLSIVPKDSTGQPITDFEKHIVYNQETGEEVKEWVALADYIASFEEVDGISQLPAKYGNLEGRKTVVDDKSLKARLTNLNGFTLTIYSVGIMCSISMLLLVRRLIIKVRRK